MPGGEIYVFSRLHVEKLDIVHRAAMALEQVPSYKRRSAVLAMERFFVGVRPLMALLVFGPGERPGTEGADILLLCSHAKRRGVPTGKLYVIC